MYEHVVGLDWVGDELGFPYCALAHGSAAKLAQAMRRGGSEKFGIRVHAGEGVIRPSSGQRPRSRLHGAFKLHVYILLEGIRKLWKNLGQKGCVGFSTRGTTA